MSTSTLSFDHQAKVSIKFGELQSVLDWCSNNCEKNWNYSDYTGLDSKNWLKDYYFPNILDGLTIEYVFSFQSEKDRLAFVLVHA